MTKMLFSLEFQYGKQRFFPENDHATAFCQTITKTKTLSWAQIEALRGLGLKVEIVFNGEPIKELNDESC